MHLRQTGVPLLVFDRLFLKERPDDRAGPAPALLLPMPVLGGEVLAKARHSLLALVEQTFGPGRFRLFAPAGGLEKALAAHMAPGSSQRGY